MRLEPLASEFLRALRGKRSQVAFSRRLGYRSNIASRWERGQCFPTAAQTFAAAARVGVDVRASTLRFFKAHSARLEAADLEQAEGVVSLMNELRGGVPIGEIANELRISRFSVSRWFSGKTEPKLPEFLALVHVLSARLLDFVSAFVDASRLPSMQHQLERQHAAREAAFARPWSHAVLRALELEKLRTKSAEQSRAIARELGIAQDEVEACLKLLELAGQVAQGERGYEPTHVDALDLRSEAERLRELKTFWINVAREKLPLARDDVFGFSVFAVSSADLLRIRDLYLDFYKSVQAVIVRSEPSECVVLWNTQMVRLDGGRD